MRGLFLSILSLFAALNISARELFSESFEAPENADVTGVTRNIPTNWTGSTEGYEALKRGLADEDSGLFSTPFGTQAANANFPTNAGMATNANVIGDIVAGATYTLSFNVAVANDHPDGSAGFLVQLRALDESAERNDIRNIEGSLGTLLYGIGSIGLGKETIHGVVKGLEVENVTSTDMSQSFSHSFTAEPGESYIGEDLVVVLIGRSRHGSGTFYDNIRVKDDIPETGTFALIGSILALTTMARHRRR